MTREFHFIINEVWCLVARWEMRRCFIHRIKVSSTSYYIILQWILYYYLESPLKRYIIWLLMTFRRAKRSVSLFLFIIIGAEGHAVVRRCPTCVNVRSDSAVNKQESLQGCNTILVWRQENVKPWENEQREASGRASILFKTPHQLGLWWPDTTHHCCSLGNLHFIPVTCRLLNILCVSWRPHVRAKHFARSTCFHRRHFTILLPQF